MSTVRPLIGVSTGLTDYGDYLGSAFTEPLERLGATAVLLGYPSGPDALDRLVERLDGLVLAVGCDLAPASYGGEQHASMTHHSTARDAAELQEHARNGGEGTCVFELLVDAAHERQTHRAPAGLAAHGRT